MQDLAASRVPEPTLRVMRTGQMPTKIWSVLSKSKDVKLDELATMADRMFDQVEPCAIAAISRLKETSTGLRGTDIKLDWLVTQIDQLTLEVVELRRGKRDEWKDNPRSRSTLRRYKNHALIGFAIITNTSETKQRIAKHPARKGRREN